VRRRKRARKVEEREKVVTIAAAATYLRAA